MILTSPLDLEDKDDHADLDTLVPGSPSILLNSTISSSSETTGLYQCDTPETRSGDTIAHQMIQARAFCGWITHILRQQISSSEIVQDLGVALTNGNILSRLMEIVLGSSIEGLGEANSVYDKITNLNLATDAFVQHYPAAIFPNASAVASNNPKALVDFAWQLFYHSTLKKIQYCGLEDRFALMLWIQHTVSSFANISLVSDFTQSLADGLVLCALIESKSPSSIDTRSMNNIQRTDNLRKAFDLAEQLFHIPKFLSPMDIISSTPDEISMIVFLTMLYKA